MGNKCRYLTFEGREEGVIGHCKKKLCNGNFVIIKENFETLHEGHHVVHNDECPYFKTNDTELCPAYVID